MTKHNYRKKPVVIEAHELTDAPSVEFVDFMAGCEHFVINEAGTLTIRTLEGDHLAQIGDMIIKGVAGEYYPCKPEIFVATYERVE